MPGIVARNRSLIVAACSRLMRRDETTHERGRGSRSGAPAAGVPSRARDPSVAASFASQPRAARSRILVVASTDADTSGARRNHDMPGSDNNRSRFVPRNTSCSASPTVVRSRSIVTRVETGSRSLLKLSRTAPRCGDRAQRSTDALETRTVSWCDNGSSRGCARGFAARTADGDENDTRRRLWVTSACC